MAIIQSLGLHEPSALSYLVREKLLDPETPSSSYQWNYQHTTENGIHTTDEVLWIDDCVVWSRNGNVKRVYNLDIEGEAIRHAFTTSFTSISNVTKFAKKSTLGPSDIGEKALVVILKTQAHIFLLSGDTHLLPLSFEVEKAIPAAHGFFLQRSHDPFPTSTRVSSSQLPKTFAFPELFSELSLVVSGSSRKHEPLEKCSVLPPDEDIAYLSPQDELHELHLASSENIYLAVTTNSSADTITIWQILFNHEDPENIRQKRPITPGRVSKRKSSNIYGRQTGIATPVARVPGAFRESFGGMGQAVPENSLFPPGREPTSHSTVDLAASLGQEFEQVGVQTRSARRVSSMLARTDLGGANDRSAFNDMALGTVGRQSLRLSIRHGESLGDFSERQSFGARRRSSFQAASSVYSDGTSFLDLPASHFIDDGNSQFDTNHLDDMDSVSATVRLAKNVGLMKLKSLPYQHAGTEDGKDRSLKVTTMLAPDRSTADDRRSRIISVCIMDRNQQEMTIVNVAAKITLAKQKYKGEKIMYDLKAVEVQRGQSIVDACKITEGSTKRLLVLTQTRAGKSVLHLEAPWAASYRMDLPTQLKVFNPSAHSQTESPTSRRETGARRIMPETEVVLRLLQNCESAEQVLALDSEHRYHRLRCRMIPEHISVQKILSMCNFVLAPEFYDSLLVAWWEVRRWLESQGPDDNVEWTALTVTLFILAVPFISTLQTRPAQGPRRKKGGALRSSSGTTVDLASWESMQDAENRSLRPSWQGTNSWSWLNTTTSAKLEPKSPSRRARNASIEIESHKDPFLIRCVNLARDFLQSPAGENAIGPEGYLPTAVSKDRAFRRTALASILIGLHLLREEAKLHDLSSSLPSEISDDLTVIIAQISSWLSWQEWCALPGQYYHTEIKNFDRWLFETSHIDTLEVPAQPFGPSSIFLHVEAAIMSGNVNPFPSLLDLVSQSRSITPNHPLWREAAQLTPRLFAVTAFISQLHNKKKAKSIINCMLECGIDDRILATLPLGIAAVCHQAILAVRARPPANLSTAAKAILDRADFENLSSTKDTKLGAIRASHSHEAARDYHLICNNAIDAEAVSRWDAFSEIDRQAITKLIFREDRRFQEASRLVNQTKPPIVEYVPEPEWTEADLLEAQKELASRVTRRTLSVAAGRAMMQFNSRTPLLTERVPIPVFSLQCVMKPRNATDDTQPLTFSADKALFTEEKVCWAFFHNGASAGLMVSKDIRWIDTSWILYNKPPELSNRYAGFLLALGLNGHLKSLAKWVAFKYLTPKHTMTSIGLLLGLAASYLGTMDTLITRLLSVHVTRLLPTGAAELNLSPLTQTTGIVGIGLLYFDSRHRRMSEIMLSEIENSDSEDRSGDQPILRDEGYRLAAGFSLGLINLGQGKKLHSLHDMSAVERLLTIAVGTKNVNFVHVLDRATAGAVIAIAFIFMKTNDEMIAQKIDIPDTTHQFDYVRPDIFLLRTLAKHLIMWDSITPSLAFIRDSLPPIFQKRANLATTRRLNTDDMALFNVLTGICFAISLRFAGSQRTDVRDLLILYLDQFLRLSKLPALNYDSKVTLNSVRNCLDVLALSNSIVMAGSGDIVVMRRLRALHGRTDKETPFGSHLAAHMALGNLFLSGGTGTFGTCNLAIAALVISLYPLFPVDILDNKCHLQALRHLWVLAVENRCLIARDAEKNQVITGAEARIELLNGSVMKLKTPGLLPEFDIIRSVRFEHEGYWPVEIALDSTSDSVTALNSSSTPEARRVNIREKLKAGGQGLKIFLQRRAAYEKPETDVFFSELQALDEARGVPSVDANARTNEEWRQTHGSTTGTGIPSDSKQTKNPLEWVFSLVSFKNMAFAERALISGDAAAASSNTGRRMLKETAVDSRLDLEIGALDIDHDDDDDDDDDTDITDEETRQVKKRARNPITVDKDKLWQLRLLFDWTDRWERENDDDHHEDDDNRHGKDTGPSNGGNKREEMTARWMKNEIVEQLKWRVWKMASEIAS